MPAVKERRASVSDHAPAPRAGHLFDPGGRRTLDDLVIGLTERAAEGRSATCPVCGESRLVETGESALACSGCGSRVE
jgi:hypothetical protein